VVDVMVKDGSGGAAARVTLTAQQAAAIANVANGSL